MPIMVKDRPVEGGSCVIEATFKDMNKQIVESTQLDSIQWTLKDSDGNVINNRENVSHSKENPANFILTGNDLPAKRLTFTVRVIYDSTYGNNLNLNDSVTFYVQNLTDNDEA